jgi:hypothetical protein
LIRDPVQRLGYLRLMTAGGLPVLPELPVLPAREAPWKRRWRRMAVVAALVLVPGGYHSEANAPLGPPVIAERARPPETLPSIWMVEKAAEFETYSNGLRIESLFAVSTRPRGFIVFSRSTGQPETAASGNAPLGILYHTTESHIAEFDEQRNAELRQSGLGLIEYVRRNGSYNFVVDRFGRVYRIVRESDAANHAGWSVWADERRVFVNLNDSFLAVAFEARSRNADGQPPINAAQVHAGRVLTELLRFKYGIPGENCVTHAQVSVNPSNFLIGYHKDWQEGFPFRALGLPDNYQQPVASAAVFGFESDGVVAPAGMGLGLLAANGMIDREAARLRMPAARYRAVLRLRWREALSALENAAVNKEKEL